MSENLSAVVAYDDNRVIGNHGDIPWRGQLPADMAHFRELTVGHTVIMGMRTYDSIGRPLRDRRNVVVTRHEGMTIQGVDVVHGIREALIATEEDSKVFVIGGSQLYEAMLPSVSSVYATVVHDQFEGDSFFPELDMEEWGVWSVGHNAVDSKNFYPYSFVEYRRGVRNRYVYMPHGQRTEDQAEAYRKIDKLEICPFCPEHLDDWHEQGVVAENAGWILTPLDFPYTNTDRHIMAIPKRHIESLSDIYPEDMTNLLSLLQWAEITYSVDSGGIVMRFGDPAHNGASVRHLHVHFVVPRHNLPRDQKVRFKIS